MTHTRMSSALHSPLAVRSVLLSGMLLLVAALLLLGIFGPKGSAAEQARVAQAYIAQLNQARVFDAAIVTKIEPDLAFYPAEDYHQDFMTLNPTYPYIVYHDLPKLEALKRLFPDLYRAEPALVAAAKATN